MSVEAQPTLCMSDNNMFRIVGSNAGKIAHQNVLRNEYKRIINLELAITYR